jgi:fibronectin type 3 domain-containing protein
MLNWNKVIGATKYQVYKYDSKTKSYKLIASTVNTSVNNTGLLTGTTYYYKVNAYTYKSSIAGAYSTILITGTKPATPSISLSSGTKKITVSWKAILGATGYEIYISTAENGTYKKVTIITNGKTIKYTKAGLTRGTTYYFKVKAYRNVDKIYMYSGFSTVKYVKSK